MLRPLVLATALAVLGGGPVMAGSFTVAAMAGPAVPFPGVPALVAAAQVEARDIAAGFGLRLSAGARLSPATGLVPAVALDTLYRFSAAQPQGPLYLGLGLGVSLAGGFAPEVRGIIGYEWALTPSLGAFLEAVPRLSLSGALPALELAGGLSFRL